MSRNPRIRFCQNNMLQASGAVLTASGAKSSFPVANIVDPYRYRQWVPPGTFVVTTSNQKIYINDGSNFTATIPAATYTYSTLATAVATALNAVSSGWTSSYDFNGGTFKFTIGRASGTKTLRLSQTTNAAWDMLGYVGVADQTAAAADQQRNHTSEWIVMDLGVAKSPLGFFVIGPADAVFPISSSATITLKANNINDFTSPAITRTLTVENTGIFHWLDDLGNTAYRYWKWEFADRLNTVGPEGFGTNIAYLGDYATPLSTNVVNGFTRQQIDTSIKQQANSGTSYWRRRTKSWKYDSMRVENLTQTDRTTLEQAYSGVGVTYPFFLALDPTQAISASAGEFTKYVTFDQMPTCSQVIYQLHSHGFTAVEEV